MSLPELTALVPPPTSPSEVGTHSEWAMIESELGTELPVDYREFVFAYGTGLFAKLYCIYNPFSANDFTALIPSTKRVCEANLVSQKDFPSRFPYAYFPEKPGLLPWANDENGNDYFWLTDGSPDQWRVVQDENRGDGISLHPFTMTEFLLSILKKQTQPLASEYPMQSDFVFESWEPHS